MSQTKNFSQYELIRQENIKRNDEFLNNLGLNPLSQSDVVAETTSSSIKKKRSFANVRSENVISIEDIPVRRSSRLDPANKITETPEI